MLLVVLAAAAMLLIFGLMVVLDPGTSPFPSIHDSDGDGYPDSSDSYPDDPFNGAEPVSFVASESWKGFSAVCTRADFTVKLDDIVIRLSSGTSETSWEEFYHPGLVGGSGAIDAGTRELGDWSLVLIIHDSHSDGMIGLGEFLYFKFEEVPSSSVEFEVTILMESTQRVVASFSYTMP